MADWIEFAEIKRAVPLMRALEQYRVGGLRRSGKDQWRGAVRYTAGTGGMPFT